MDSDHLDEEGWKNAPDGADIKSFSRETGYANVMVVCMWFSMLAQQQKWSRINAQRIRMAKQYSVITETSDLKALTNFGTTILHELTHTNQGGKLLDVDESERPDGVNSCYGWDCVIKLHRVDNAGQ